MALQGWGSSGHGVSTGRESLSLGNTAKVTKPERCPIPALSPALSVMSRCSLGMAGMGLAASRNLMQRGFLGTDADRQTDDPSVEQAVNQMRIPCCPTN